MRRLNCNRTPYSVQALGTVLFLVAIARCMVERLMRQQGLQGARRGKQLRTIRADPKAACQLDRVNRQFRADRPNQLWVSDFTPYQ